MPPSTPSPFDPRTWLPSPAAPASTTTSPSSASPRSENRTWLDTWVDLTTWWVEPAIQAGQSAGATMRPDQVLTQLIDGMARRFEGQRVDVEVRGRRVRAVLDAIRLARKATRSELSLDLADVDVDGTRLDRLEVRARSVSVGSGATPTFTASDIDVDGDVPLRSVVAMVDERVDDWSIGVDDDDRVTAGREDRHLVVRVEPVVHAGQLRLELRSVRWRGMAIGVPRWLRLDRTYAIPLEPGWTVADASQHGRQVHFRIHGDRVTEDLDLARLRDAILGAGPLTV